MLKTGVLGFLPSPRIRALKVLRRTTSCTCLGLQTFAVMLQFSCAVFWKRSQSSVLYSTAAQVTLKRSQSSVLYSTAAQVALGFCLVWFVCLEFWFGYRYIKEAGQGLGGKCWKAAVDLFRCHQASTKISGNTLQESFTQQEETLNCQDCPWG